MARSAIGAVPVVGRGDDHGVDRLVVEDTSEIIARVLGADGLLAPFQSGFVRIADVGDRAVELDQFPTHQDTTAAAGHAERDPIVGPLGQNRRGRGCQGGESHARGLQEVSARFLFSWWCSVEGVGGERRWVRKVGWVERSEPHHKGRPITVVGLAALDPPYLLPFRSRVRGRADRFAFHQGGREHDFDVRVVACGQKSRGQLAHGEPAKLFGMDVERR